MLNQMLLLEVFIKKWIIKLFKIRKKVIITFYKVAFPILFNFSHTADINHVAKQLGHSSHQMIFRTYGSIYA